MRREKELLARVRAAKGSARAADDLVRDYLPFIKSETAKFMGRPPREGADDELGIAMFAFHEAVVAYDRGRGAFLPLAVVLCIWLGFAHPLPFLPDARFAVPEGADPAEIVAQGMALYAAGAVEHRRLLGHDVALCLLEGWGFGLPVRPVELGDGEAAR